MRSFLLFIITLFTTITNAQTISTVVGTGVAGYNGDGIADTLAQLNYPQGLALDGSGNLYIADMVNHRIRKVNMTTGIISTVAGTGTGGYNGDGIDATTAQINVASSIAFDANGDLYFTDRGNNRVRKITTSTGIISTVAGTGTASYNGDGIDATTAQLYYPNEVAFDKNGDLFIGDWLNHRVRKVDRTTGLISTVVGTGTGSYNGDGIDATTAQINGPCGIIFDNAGNMYVAEYGGARIRKINKSDGLISTIAGTGSGGYNGDGILATAAQLSGCAYIRSDGAGNMYIGEGGSNHRIRKITAATGMISTIAGTGTAGYNGDGISASTAQLYNPYDMVFDSTYTNLYIGDCSNHRIRKITGLAGVPPPTADFSASATAICNEFGACIDFLDHSSSNTTKWKWSFPGATPDTSTQQNPTNICYYVSGRYPATLIASNAGGADTLTVTPIFTFGVGPAVPLLTLSHDTLFSTPAVSYQWLYNGAPITGATDSSYVIPGNGTYAVEITDSLGCKKTSADFLATTTSITKFSDKNFMTIVSDPLSATAIVRFNTPVNAAVIILYDVLGKEMFSKQFTGSTLEIEKGMLKSGIYFVSVRVKEQQYVEKMVVE